MVNEFITSIKIQTKKICYFFMLNISIYRNSLVELSTTVIMLLETMLFVKLLLLFKYLWPGSVLDNKVRNVNSEIIFVMKYIRNLKKSYHSTIYCLSTICSDPNIAIHTSLSRFLGNLRLHGRDPTDIISEVALLCYFPIKTTIQQPPDIDTLNYAYSFTRPTTNQLQPFTTLPFRLIPILPIAPIKSLQTYLSPTALSHPNRCEVCQSYHLFFPTNLHHILTPCLMYRNIYAVFAPLHLVVYIGQTGATSRMLDQKPHNHRFMKHRTLTTSIIASNPRGACDQSEHPYHRVNSIIINSLPYYSEF